LPPWPRAYREVDFSSHLVQAHCLMARISAALPFPFLTLLVSGGHCLLMECRGLGRFHILGGTLDDALGEAYDKAARLLRIGSGVAGGPALEVRGRAGQGRLLWSSGPLTRCGGLWLGRLWPVRGTPRRWCSPCR
jgi:N6-L-threonylcarbamoyladenine synthase